MKKILYILFAYTITLMVVLAIPFVVTFMLWFLMLKQFELEPVLEVVSAFSVVFGIVIHFLLFMYLFDFENKKKEKEQRHPELIA